MTLYLTQNMFQHSANSFNPQFYINSDKRDNLQQIKHLYIKQKSKYETELHFPTYHTHTHAETKLLKYNSINYYF